MKNAQVNLWAAQGARAVGMVVIALAVTHAGTAAARAEIRRPIEAKLNCHFNNGDLDYSVKFVSGAAEVVITRDDESTVFRKVAVTSLERSVVLAATSPDEKVMAMFVIGEENHITYYQDGNFLDDRECRLIEAKYPE